MTNTTIKNTLLKSGIILTIFAFAYLVVQASIEAAPSGTVTLSPAKSEIVLQPGQSKVVVFTLTNNLDEDAHIILGAEDLVGSVDGTFASKLIGASSSAYSLKDLLKSPVREFDLAPGTTKKIEITISVPETVVTGGKYGAVTFTIRSKGTNDTSNGSGAVLQSRLGAQIFVKVPGNIKESAKLLRFSTINNVHIYVSERPRLQFAISNDGNVHLNPYGYITISNIFGSQSEIIRVPPGFVLPGATRTFTFDTTSKYGFGRYTAKLALNRGYGDIVDYSEITYWRFSLTYVLGLLAVLILFIALYNKVKRQHSIS